MFHQEASVETIKTTIQNGQYLILFELKKS